jgi:hypothetical protein
MEDAFGRLILTLTRREQGDTEAERYYADLERYAEPLVRAPINDDAYGRVRSALAVLIALQANRSAESPHGGTATPEGKKPAAKPEAVAEPPVVLGKAHEDPIVMGNQKPKLTHARYHIVKALLKAGEIGLTGDALVDQSGHEGAVNVLKALARDRDWKRVISLAGKPGGRYRIVRPPDEH